MTRATAEFRAGGQTQFEACIEEPMDGFRRAVFGRQDGVILTQGNNLPSNIPWTVPDNAKALRTESGPTDVTGRKWAA